MNIKIIAILLLLLLLVPAVNCLEENNNTSIETKTMPAKNENLNERHGLGAVFSIIGLIAVAYLVKRN